MSVPPFASADKSARGDYRSHRDPLPERCRGVFNVTRAFQVGNSSARFIWQINPGLIPQTEVNHILGEIFFAHFADNKGGSCVHRFIEHFLHIYDSVALVVIIGNLAAVQDKKSLVVISRIGGDGARIQAGRHREGLYG